MSSLLYVGAAPSNTKDLTTHADVEEILNPASPPPGTVSRSYVNSRITTLSAGKATKVYVDNQDATFTTPDYVATQDAKNIPTSAKGVAGGVAALDSGGKIPLVNVPILGAGIIRGPFAHTQGYAVPAASITPQKIADFPVLSGVNGQIMAFMTVLCLPSATARPCVEIRYSLTGDTVYANQTLVAQGYGRTYFGDNSTSQTVLVMPVTAVAGEGQDGVQDTISAGSNITLTAWIYDAAAVGGQVAVNSGYIVSSAIYLARTLL